MKKRFFGMLLSVAMVVSVLTVGVSADGLAAEGYYLTSETYYYGDECYSTTTYTYDSDGNLTQEVYERDSYSSTITYAYDSNGNLTKKVSDSYTYNYTYDSNGNLTKEAYGSTTITYTYDSYGNLVKKLQKNSSGSTYTYNYTYDSSGNLTELVYKFSSGSTTSTKTTTYTYDSKGNLTTEVCGSNTTTNKYDSNGNLTEKVVTSGTYVYTYTYSYDSSNNLVKEVYTAVDNYSSYTASYPSTTTTTYKYDSNGNLVKQIVEMSARTDTYVYTYNTLAELQSPFTDVKDETKWYFDAVIWASNKSITAGTSDITFSPNMDCSRAQIVTFLWRAAGSPEPTTTKNPFTDVKKSAYYYKAVLWAVENGITAGTSSTTFSPDKSCTRAEAVTFLYRYEGSPSVSTTSKFTDVGSTWYTNAVAWAVKNGITAGTTKTTFSPNTTCSRAMIVTFLYRDMAD